MQLIEEIAENQSLPKYDTAILLTYLYFREIRPQYVIRQKIESIALNRQILIFNSNRNNYFLGNMVLKIPTAYIRCNFPSCRY